MQTTFLAKIRLMLIVISAVVIVTALTGGSQATEVKIAWQAEFNSETEENGSVVLFESRGGGELPIENRIYKISDGYLTFGLDPASGKNRHCMIWGKNVWWAQVQTPEWGPWDLKEYPVIEVKYRPARAILFYFDITDNSGNHDAFYAYGNSWPKKKVTDERGEWTVAIIRLSPDSSVPKARTIRYLNGLNLCTYGQEKRNTIEVDYIRIRGFNDEEAKKEADVIRLLGNWPKRDYPRLREFFPYGGYTGDYGWWRGGGFEGQLGLLSRYHFNSRWVDDSGKWSRFAAHDESDPNKYLEKSFARWFGRADAQVAACEATGTKMLLDLRYGDQEVLFKFDEELTRKWIKQIVDRYGNNDTVLGWFIGDEPFASDIWPLCGLQRIIEDADPTRPTAYVYCSAPSVKAFGPYMRINYWDRYPIDAQNRDPWMIADFTRDMAKLSEAPTWALLQTYTLREDYYYSGSMKKSGRTLPSAAEVRLMAYLSLANGAEGVGWYQWFSGNEVDLVDRFGSVSPLIEEVSRVGWRCTTVGRLLLDGQVEQDSKIKVVTNDPGGYNLSVGVIKNDKKNVTYLVVVNEDVENVRSGTVHLTEAESVMDLYRCKSVRPKERTFTVEPLGPGDGRIYAVAKYGGILAAEVNLIRQYCAEEILRAMTPDLSIARRWKLDLELVDKLIGQTRTAVKAGRGIEAETFAKQVRLTLEEAMVDNSAFASVRNTLDEARVFLSEAQYMIMGSKQENLTKPAAATKDIYDSFLQLGQEFSSAMAAFIAGQTEGLAPKAEALRMSAREHLLSATASMRKAIEKE